MVPSRTSIKEAIQQAEWDLVLIHRSQAASEEELRQAIESFQSVCQKLIAFGPEVVGPLRELVLSTQFGDFNQSQTAARILPELPFPEAAQVLLEAALSPDPVTANRGWQNLQCLPPSEGNFQMLAEAFTAPTRNDAERHKQHLLIDALGRQSVPAFFQAAEQWIQDGSDTYVRRSLAISLSADGRPEAVAILRAAMNDHDAIVQIRAIFGLILAGEQELLGRLLDAAQARTVGVRIEAISWLGRLSLPTVAQPVLNGLSDTSTKVQMASIVGIHDLGVRESLIPLTDVLNHRSIQIVEQAAIMLRKLVGCDLPYAWEGRRLTPASVVAVQELCHHIYNNWEPGSRYLHGKLMTIRELADSLLLHHAAFWILAGMTGQRFDFVSSGDILVNWHSIQRWCLWTKEHESDFQPGLWYYLGHLQDTEEAN
jgi:hypothetical protein